MKKQPYKNRFTKLQYELFLTMSRIASKVSPCCYDSHGTHWLKANSFVIYRAMLTGDLRYGFSLLDDYDLNICRNLNRELNGWILWSGLSSAGDHYPTFVPQGYWERLYDGHKTFIDHPTFY